MITGIQDMVRTSDSALPTRWITSTPHSRKKNAPYLYDLVITHALDWPTLTCQWFPDKES